MRGLAVVSIALLGACRAAVAQIPEDASVIPHGMLRLTLDPQRRFWDERFTVDGERERWTADFEAAPLGVTTIPSLGPVQAALRSLTGLSSFTLALGTSTLAAEADIRGTPLGLEIGLFDRLMVGVSAPLVRTRVKASFMLDTAGANVGWNPVLVQAGDPEAAAAYDAFFVQLDQAIAQLEANIAAGMYGCPGSAMCAAAQELAMRAAQRRAGIATLVLGDGVVAPTPVMPLAGTQAAMQLDAIVAGLQAEFALFGVAGFTQMLAHPDSSLGSGDFGQLVTDSTFGIAARPLGSVSAWRLGDVNVSAKLLVVNGGRYRLALAGLVRFPTGALDHPDHFFDLGAGDRQLDLEVRLHQDLRPFDELALSTAVRYVKQGPLTLPRRVTSHDRPIAALETLAEVERDPGDMLEVSVTPTVMLSPEASVFLTGTWYRKEADEVTFAGAPPAGGGLDATALAVNTEEQAWRAGGGIRYRASGRFETGLTYVSSFRGKGGQTPAVSFAAVTVRLYYGLFARRRPEAPPPPAAPPP